MKKIFLSMLLLICLIPASVFADTQALDLKDTVEAEGLTLANENYEETDDQVTLYLFRQTGCTHCEDLITYLNELSADYGDKFKVRSYEVSSNQDNYNLKDSVVEFLDIEAPGVPLLIIGESTFYGFSDDDKENVLKAIEEEYSQSSRYDILEEMQKKDDSKNHNDFLYILIPVVGVLIIAYIISAAKKE